MTDTRVQRLLEYMRCSDRNLRSRALGLVSHLPTRKINDPAFLSHFVIALHDEDFRVRYTAGSILKRLGHRALPYLLDALQDEDNGVVAEAARALGDMKNPTATPALIDTLHSGKVNWLVAEALGKIGDVTAVPDLLKVLRTSSDNYVKRAAATALGNIGHAAALPGLIEALRDTDVWVQTNAIWALWTLGDPAAEPELINCLHDEDAVVRGTAVWALEKVGTSKAVPALIERLSDDGETNILKDDHETLHLVCELAALALERIGTPEALAAVEVWRQSQR